MAPLVFSALCVVFIAMAIPLILQKVPPNCVYGFRTRKTLSSEAAWYKANKFLGIGLVVSSAVSLLLFSLSFARDYATLILVLPIGVLLVVSALYVRSL